MEKEISEARLSQDCNVWLWNWRPESRGLYCLNLNNTGLHLSASQVSKWVDKVPSLWIDVIINKIEELNRRIAGVNKSSGLIKGRYDATLHDAKFTAHFEFKVGNNSRSTEQIVWCDAMESISHHCFVTRTKEEFQTQVKSLYEKYYN